jgi:putative endonuclease
MNKIGYIYLMTNKSNNVIYAGVTSNLKNRVYENKTGKFANSFTHKFNVEKLGYFETFTNIEQAIDREKQIKGGSRKKKEDLIKSKNPDWKDLYEEL